MKTYMTEPPGDRSVFPDSNDKEVIRCQGDQAKLPHRVVSPSPPHHYRKRRKMMAASPYFQAPTNSANIHEKKMPSSLYFQKSPSSTYGSIRSLGSLIGTWTGCTSAVCRKKDNETANFPTTSGTISPSFDLKICHACYPIIQSAMAHFQECHCFQKRLQTLVLQGDTSLPCTLQMESKIQEAVCHLCPHQCFVKAFAPSREWVFFRKELHERTDEPIDDLLQGWTCRLVHEHRSVPHEAGKEDCQKESLQHQKANKNADPSGETPIGAIYPRVEFFCSKTNKSCATTREVMRTLGLEDSKKKKKKKKIRTVDTDDEIRIVDDKGNGSKSSSFYTPISEDLQLSRIIPPCTVTKHPKLAPLVSTGRRRLWTEPRQRIAASESLPLSVLRTASGRSPLGLLEELFVGDPWKLLVSAILLNRSRRAQVDYILWGFLEQWPTPQALLASSNAARNAHSVARNTNDHDDLRKWIQPLGLQTRRSQGLVQFCKDYLCLLNEKRRQMKPIPTTSSRTTSERQKEEGAINADDSNDPAFHLTRDEILGLYNCGEYVADAYQIFIVNHADSNKKEDWKNLNPKDHALLAYVEWKRSADTGGNHDEKQ